MRLLAFAYACEPDRGSEPGAGWSWARMLAGYGEVTVLTRSNNQAAIEAALPNVPERDNLQFAYVDLPAWARFWKRGRRGVRLYHMLWQVAAVSRARRLHRAQPFDLVWHLTMSNIWLGSLAPLVNAPFVYGPMGGGVKPRWRLFPSLGARGLIHETTYAIAQKLGRYANPIAGLATRRARLILVQNEETLEWVPARHRNKAVVFHNAVLENPPVPGSPREPGRTALYAGILGPAKGISLALRAVCELPGWRLVVCGAGTDESRLRRLAQRLRIVDRVSFAGWVPRAELHRRMVEEADVFLFPSLHEGSSWVLHEARAAGLPVVCLAHCGSEMLATSVVPVGSPRATARELAQAVRLAAVSAPPPAARSDLATRREQLAAVLRGAGLLTDDAAAPAQATS